MTDADPMAQAVPFPDVVAWAAWLDEHAGSSTGVWLRLAKKGSGHASVTYDEALELALCHGWIDGQKRPFDDEWWLQRFTPRRPTSRWSKRNVEIVDRLIAEARMLPAGQAEVDRARADGRWAAAYAGSRTMTVPDDLQAALDAEPVVAAAFAGLDGANRYAILYRLQDAKRPETRARRLADYLQMLREGRTLHPRRGRSAGPRRAIDVWSMPTSDRLLRDSRCDVGDGENVPGPQVGGPRVADELAGGPARAAGQRLS